MNHIHTTQAQGRANILTLEKTSVNNIQKTQKLVQKNINLGFQKE